MNQDLKELLERNASRRLADLEEANDSDKATQETVEVVDTLMKIINEDEKREADFQEIEVKMKDLELKEKQIKSQSVEKWLRFGVEVAKLTLWGSFIVVGFFFEENGTITSFSLKEVIKSLKFKDI